MARGRVSGERKVRGFTDMTGLRVPEKHSFRAPWNDRVTMGHGASVTAWVETGKPANGWVPYYFQRRFGKAQWYNESTTYSQ